MGHEDHAAEKTSSAILESFAAERDLVGGVRTSA
jgi:hypothetical protein